MADQLNIEESLLEGFPILTCSGELSLYTAEDFLKSALNRKEPIIVIDLLQLSYLDSSGMGALLKLCRRPPNPHNTMVLICLDIFELFKSYAHPPPILGGLPNLFTSRDEALVQVRAKIEAEQCTDPTRLYTLAQVLRKGPFDCLNAFQRSHQLGGPEHPPVKVDFLLELADLHSPMESYRYYEEALELAPHEIRIYRKYVDCLMKHKDFREALDVLERIPSSFRRQFEKLRVRISTALHFPSHTLRGDDPIVIEEKHRNRIRHLIARQNREPLQCALCHYIGDDFKARERALHGGRGYVICPRCGNSRVELIL